MDKLNQWFTLTANVAILVGIAFLVVELNQNTSSLRLAARQALTQENSEFVKLLIEHKELGSLFSKAVPADRRLFSDLEGLDEDQALRLGRLLFIAFINLENQYHAWQDDALTDNEWEPSDALLDLYAGSNTIQNYWKSGGARLHGASFSEYFSAKFVASNE